MAVNPDDQKKPARRAAGVPPFIPKRESATGPLPAPTRGNVARPFSPASPHRPMAPPPAQMESAPQSAQDAEALASVDVEIADREIMPDIADSPREELMSRVDCSDSELDVIVCDPLANAYDGVEPTDPPATSSGDATEPNADAWTDMGTGDGLGWDYSSASSGHPEAELEIAAGSSLGWADDDVALASSDFVTGDAASRLDPDVFAPTDIGLPLADGAALDGELATPTIPWDALDASDASLGDLDSVAGDAHDQIAIALEATSSEAQGRPAFQAHPSDVAALDGQPALSDVVGLGEPAGPERAHPVADALSRVADRIRSGELIVAIGLQAETDAAALAAVLAALLRA